MRIQHTEITPYVGNPVFVVERDVPYFDSPFHSHPELELVYIKEGFGTYTIGDTTDTFQKDEVFFLGSNVPHHWNSDDVYKKSENLRSKALVMYFNLSILNPSFFSFKETQLIDIFLKKATRGVLIKGTTRKLIIQKLEYISKASCFEKLIRFFDILHLLSQSDDLHYISTEILSTQPIIESDRLTDVFKYLKENLNKVIKLKEIANIACLSTGAFCRYFKNRTGKTFFEYLNEIRISQACSLLIDTELSIAQIAANCGFKTPSNFTKVFKDVKGTSPKKFQRKAITGILEIKANKNR